MLGSRVVVQSNPGASPESTQAFWERAFEQYFYSGESALAPPYRLPISYSSARPLSLPSFACALLVDSRWVYIVAVERKGHLYKQ